MKKKLGLPLICGAVLVLMALIAIILPAAHGLYADGSILGQSYKFSVSGYQLIFGDSGNSVDLVPGLLIAWIFVLLALLGGIGGVVLLFLGKDKKVATFDLSTLILCFAGLLLFIAGILFFCAKPLSDSGDGVKLGAGFIIAGIAGLLGGLSGMAAFICPLVLKK
jgi:hypothetical protein